MKNNTMIVMVISCSDESYWYKDMIGEIVTVYTDKLVSKPWYQVSTTPIPLCLTTHDIEASTYYIMIDDCQDMSRELKLERIING